MGQVLVTLAVLEEGGMKWEHFLHLLSEAAVLAQIPLLGLLVSSSPWENWNAGLTEMPSGAGLTGLGGHGVEQGPGPCWAFGLEGPSEGCRPQWWLCVAPGSPRAAGKTPCP